MVRKTLIAALLLGTLPAFAANFAGRYVGVVAGNADGTETFHSDETNPVQLLDVSGTAYGLVFGYNIQHDDIVIGTEFEIQVAGAEGSIDEAALNNNFGYDIDSEISDAYRLRVRFGFPMENFMPFFAAGITSATTTLAAGCATCTPLMDPIDVNRMGFSVGLGLEWQMTDSWSFRGEYLTEDFGNVAYNSYDVVGDTWDTNLTIDTLRLGASWKF
jgi:outer membrane immunogenic protein